MFAPLVLVLALPAAEPNEAEKLFRQMEEKIAKSKAIECNSEIKFVAGPEGESHPLAKFTLLLADGNRMRLGITHPGSENTEEVFDGVKKSDPRFHEAVRTTLTRSVPIFVRPSAIAFPAFYYKEWDNDKNSKPARNSKSAPSSSARRRWSANRRHKSSNTR